MKCYFTIAALLFLSHTSYALPIGANFEFTERASPVISGVVSLAGCSGSVVQFRAQLETEKAYVMTNGHCIGSFQAAGTAVVNKAVTESFTAFTDTKQTLKLTSNLLAYATMSGTDVAFYRLGQTIQELKKQNVKVFIVSETPAAIDDDLTVASGFWRKTWGCKLTEQLYQIKEDQWIWVDSLVLEGQDCNMIDGASGSPVISNDTSEIVGIWNTWNEKGKKCTLDNPCEVDAKGNIKVNHLRRYGQQIWPIYTCLNNKNEIDVTLTTCLLVH